MHRIRTWFAGLVMLMACFGFQVQAQSTDYSRGVDVSGSTAVIWFKPNVAVQWVDLHYNLANTGQQNFRMSYNGGSARYEKAISPVSAGQVLGYSFTYGDPGRDTPWFSTTIGGGTTPTGRVCFYENANYSGASLCADADSSWIGTAWNDRASSMKVQAGYQAQLYRDVNYRGGFIAVTGDVPDLGARGFNDQTSSFKVAPTGTGGIWNERTTFVVQNLTRGRWANNNVYYAIIGKSWQTGQFVWVNAAGQQIPMSDADNGALVKNGERYSNYFHRVSDVPSVTIAPINSARILLSVGSPMYIKVVRDGNGNIGYAGANIENPSDPNLDVYFDFGEMAILPKSAPNPGIYVNTTRVDHFGFPLRLRVQGLNGYDRTVGERVDTITRDDVISRFVARVPTPFKALGQAPHTPLRVIAPAHANFGTGKPNAGYLQPYIDQVWARYRNEDLVFTLPNLGTFRGRISGDTFRFTGGNQNGTFFINGKPDTQMVFLGNGLLNDARNAASQDIGTQLQIQAQVAAALNRHVIETPANWYNRNAFYPAGSLANWYAKFWHDSDIAYDFLAYGFSYDDVGDHSPSLYTTAPTTVTYSIGW
ncbi:MAG: beta-1,3-glucanase family protein [Pseudomonadota bacterium]